MGKETAPIRVIPTEEYFSLVRRQLAENGHAYVRVTGSSMRPLLRDRESIVIVEDVKRVPPQKGDVVLYRAGGGYVLHRVMRADAGDFLIRGDNTLTYERVPKADVIATMTGYYRGPHSRMIARGGFCDRFYRAALRLIRLVRRVRARIRRAAGSLFGRGR